MKIFKIITLKMLKLSLELGGTAEVGDNYINDTFRFTNSHLTENVWSVKKKKIVFVVVIA